MKYVFYVIAAKLQKMKCVPRWAVSSKSYFSPAEVNRQIAITNKSKKVL